MSRDCKFLDTEGGRRLEGYRNGEEGGKKI